MAAALSSKFLKGIGSLQSLRSTRVESASSVYQNGMLRSYSTTVPSDSDTHDDFKPTQKVPSGSSNSLKDIVENDVKENPVMIYMKGVPEAPQCGFSSLAVRVLQQYSVPISARNILEDQELKSAVKSFSHWPTFPQIFIKGEFIGGSDIILNMHKGGELEAKLKDVNQKSQDVGAAFPWIVWYIWKTRNEKIFNDKDITPMDTLHLAIEEAESWSLAQRMDTAPAPDEAAPHGDGNEDAHQPPHSRWRCQSDASWINERDRAGLGFVLLDADSPTFFGAKGVKCAISPLHAEVEGLLWAMQEILKLGYREIRFELDCEQLIKIIEEKDDWPSLASEIDEIKALSMEFTVCSFAYIPRVLNVCADSLAKGVAKGGRSRVFGFPFVNYFAPSWLAPYVS